LARAAATLQERGKELACIYLHELVSGTSSAEFKGIYSKIPLSSRPQLVVGTTSLNARSTDEMRYLKRPFGLGALIEVLQSSCERAVDIMNGVKESGYVGLPITYQTAAKLVGVDETGGILQVRFRLLQGSKVFINHGMLTAAT